MNGHAFISSMVELNADVFPDMNPEFGLISRQFFRCATDQPFVRHDLRIWEAGSRNQVRLKDPGGKFLLGDEMAADWRSRSKRGTARVRAYYDVHPDRSSELTLDPSNRNKWGDPMPKIEHRLDAATQGRAAATKQHIQQVFERLARNDDGKILTTSEGRYLDHPAGGCRMGADPATSVCDSFGRTHDHENLFVVGAPTTPTGGCTNGTLTFVALTLRSAERIGG